MLTIEDKSTESTKAAAADDGAPGRAYSSARTRPPHSAGKNRPFLLMVGGLVVIAVSSLALVREASRAPGQAPAGTRPPVAAVASSGVTLGGPADVTIQMATYEPGQSSGWHTHTGMHAVMVMSGTLTFYDGECHARTYGPGDTYVGGQDLHLARNETATPVEIAVTYMFPTGVNHTQFHVPSPAPAGCDIG